MPSFACKKRHLFGVQDPPPDPKPTKGTPVRPRLFFIIPSPIAAAGDKAMTVLIAIMAADLASGRSVLIQRHGCLVRPEPRRSPTVHSSSSVWAAPLR